MTATDLSQRDLDYRPTFVTALAVIASLLAFTLGWGMYARLDSATMAHGVLFAESERKTIESLEGGILEQLLVSPGDRVQKGQVVAILDGTQNREKLAQLNVDELTLSFTVWRLEGEIAGARALDPATAPNVGEPRTRADQQRAEEQLFGARLGAYEGTIEGLRRQIDGLRAQIGAAAGQARAAARQIEIWQEERAQIATLAEKGATPRQRLLEVDRTIAGLQGALEEQQNFVVAAEKDIARSETEIETTRQTRLADIGGQLAEARRALGETTSRIRAIEDVIARQSLRAPQDGVIVNIFTITPGAVVGSGAPLMELIPDGDKLMVLARISPDAIDTVHVGRPAKIHLTAYRRAIAPVVEGKVTYVSADLLTDERDGSSYFEVRVSPDLSSIADRSDVSLVAGMPVEVAIEIGERRAAEYFLEPFLRLLRGAFNEE